MLIKLNIDKVDQATINDLINFHSSNLLPRYQHLQNYYEGRHDILNKTVSDESKPNNKLVNNYPKYITNLITGYFMGKPVAYSSKSNNDAYLQVMQNIFDYNDEADENAELAKTGSIKGEAFELLYLDESGKIRFTKIDDEQTILVYGTEVDALPVLGIRYYKLHTLNSIDVAEQTKVEVYTKNEIVKYDYFNGELTETERKEHFFKEVPIIHFLNNEEVQGDFEDIITLADAYNSSQSDTQDNFDYFTDAYLTVTGATLGDGEEAVAAVKEMKRNRVIELPEGGSAAFLTKDINDTAEENHKKRLNADIHKFANTPDLSDVQFSGNVTGVAIKFKYSCTESLASLKERKFKKALQRRIELITNILNIKGNNYDYTDIEMTFSRSLPTNVTEISDMVQKLSGVASQETLLSQLPFVTDVQAEMDKIKQEKEDNLSDDYSNLNQDNNSAADNLISGEN
jgi:SPP1 family phage portal protein